MKKKKSSKNLTTSDKNSPTAHPQNDVHTTPKQDIPTDQVPKNSRNNSKKYAAFMVAAIAVLGGIAEFSGYSLSDLIKLIRKETTEQHLKPQVPSQNAISTGDKSPAVIINNGNGFFHYDEFQIKKDSTINE